MNEANGLNATAASGVNAIERTQALAQARHKVGENALQRAEQAEVQRADSRENARAIIGRALGTNTRLSVARNDSAATFIYRAIDIETGEVVHEWPPAEFADFVAEHGGSIDPADFAGAVIDHEV